MSDKIEKCPKCQIVITVATITDRGACENCGLDYNGSIHPVTGKQAQSRGVDMFG